MTNKITTKVNDLTNAEYRAADGFSKSDLDLVNKSPALLEWARSAKSEESAAASIGTLTHTALLEPLEFEKLVKMPDGLTPKKRADFVESMPDHEVIEHKTYTQVVAMRDSVLAHPVANALLTSRGESEVSIFSGIEGLNVKCRPDRIPYYKNFGHVIVDLKTTDDPNKFYRSVKDYRYHVQAAYYSDIYKNLTGEAPRFIFVVVGKKREMGRYPVRVFELPQNAIEAGRAEYLRDLEAARDLDAFGCGFDIETVNYF